MNNGEAIFRFFSDDDPLFREFNKEDLEENEELIQKIVDLRIEYFLFAIQVREYPIIEAKDIPMFSEFADAENKLLCILDSFGEEGITYLELGKYLRETNIGNDTAFYKYGETHSKLAAMLGFVTINKHNNKYRVKLTNLGEYYILHQENKERILIRCILKIKVIQYLIKKASIGLYNCYDLLGFLSEKTIIRRTPNIKCLIRVLEEADEYNFYTITKNLLFQKKELHDADIQRS